MSLSSSEFAEVAPDLIFTVLMSSLSFLTIMELTLFFLPIILPGGKR